MPTKSTGKPRRPKYGMMFPGHWSVLDIELFCFKTARTPEQGGLGQFEHFWKIVAYLWGPKNPIGNRTKIFVRNPWSEDMVREACEQKYIAVGGSASSTKSETFALWLLVNYLADPRNVLGIMLSTSLKEARKRIWGSLVELIRAIPAPGLPLKIADSIGIIRYNSPSFQASDKSSLSLIAAERKQEKEAIGKLIGQHNNFVIVVADELSELTDSILEYALPGGNLTSNPRYQFTGLANPDGYYDPFAKLWKPKAGWLSISVDSNRWKTENGIALHFDAYQSPNVLAGKTLYPFLPTLEKIEDAKKAEGGENSIRFWRMLRGFPSPLGQEDLIYNQVDIVKFKGDEPAIWNDQPTIKVASLDPGFTNGGDRSIATLGTVGVSSLGIKTLCFELQEELVADVSNTKEGHSEQIARLFKDFCERHGVSPVNAAIDSTGAGGPFCDIVNMVFSTAVLRVGFGGKASDQPVSMTDPTPGVERYHNRVTEIWYSGRELLRQNQLKGISPEMAREMCIRRYGTTGVAKRIYAESKLDLKLRTGGKSPDLTDSGFILVALCRERLGFTSTLAAEQTKAGGIRTWRKLRQKLDAARHQRPTHLNYAPRNPNQLR